MDAGPQPQQPQPTRGDRRRMTPARWVGAAVAGLLLLVVAALLLLDWNLLRHPIERLASARSGRSVRIEGNLEVHPWSSHPTVIVNGLSVGNPPWETATQPMLHVARLEVQLLLWPLLK